ncbi:MAG: hypothetical protein HYV90_05375 [Candidatus Woesebacteria bacterium]|nr:MAG: hypothetical protein HYV90_05375 [Candidatus Woesebacteria bacterium]
MDAKLELRTEYFEKKNIRFLGYHFLRNVSFNGEPVVPVIISEADEVGNRHFNVERLGGMDLDDLMDVSDSAISLKDKLEVVRHVVLQLKAIDDAGFWIHDRAGRNVKVLSWGLNGISTRQVDLEDFYDKKTNSLYSDHRSDYLEQFVDRQYILGQTPWAYCVGQLALLVTDSLPDRYKNVVDFGKYESLLTVKVVRNPLAVNPLVEFRKDLDRLISDLEAS